jgi:hypothetical protein
MKTCFWEKIDDFQNINEFNRFVGWLNEQVKSGEAEEIPTGELYLEEYAGFQEKWFRHIGSGEIWRLVWPDAPFTGLFERVK